MGDHTKRLGQGSIASTRHGTSPQGHFQETRVATRPASNDLPNPEFLSLTYTLPYHLVEQVNETARITNRSRSEILADAIRLYLEQGTGQPGHTHVSHHEEYSYQETGPVNGDGRYDAPPQQQQSQEESTTTVSDTTRTEFKAWAARTKRTRVSTFESYSYEEVADNAIGRPSNSHETPLPVLDVTPQEAATTPPPAAPEPVPQGPAPATEARAAEAEVMAEPEVVLPPEAVPDPGVALVPEVIAAPAPAGESEVASEPEREPEPEAGVEPEAEPEPEVEPDMVVVAKEPVPEVEEPVADAEMHAAAIPGPTDTDGDGDGDVAKTEDPAAEVRLRLDELVDEPLDSRLMERHLVEIMRRVDMKDFSPPEHSSKVAEMARELASAKGLRGKRLHEVYIAGLVHDIGKACIPDETIKKAKPSSAEMALIRQYPEFGAELLGAIPAMQPVAQIVAAHQERWNGSGYPKGSVRTEIPVAAQIVALCDVYDVLNTARRYRPAYSQEHALQIIKQNVGALWNPDIARAFLAKIAGESQKLRAGAGG